MSMSSFLLSSEASRKKSDKAIADSQMSRDVCSEKQIFHAYGV